MSVRCFCFICYLQTPESDFFSELSGVGSEYTERQGEAKLVYVFQRSGTPRHRGEVACWEKVFLLVFIMEERPVLDNHSFSVLSKCTKSSDTDFNFTDTDSEMVKTPLIFSLGVWIPRQSSNYWEKTTRVVSYTSCSKDLVKKLLLKRLKMSSQVPRRSSRP